MTNVAPPSNRKDSDSGVLVPLPLPRVTPEMCHGGRAAPPAEQCQPRAKGNKEHNQFLAKASAALVGEGCGKGSRGSYRVVTPLSLMHTGCMTMMMMGRHMVLASVLRNAFVARHSAPVGWEKNLVSLGWEAPETIIARQRP